MTHPSAASISVRDAFRIAAYGNAREIFALVFDSQYRALDDEESMAMSRAEEVEV